MSSYTGPLYETFGISELGANERQVDTKGEPVDIPYNELTEGLKHLEISVYGDAPLEPFVHVVATTQERATNVFNQALKHIEDHIKEWIQNG